MGLATGQIKTVIDRSFPLEQVAAAHRYIGCCAPILIGMGAGTQALILMAGGMIAGKPSVLSRAVLMGAAWMINLAVAEWIIRRRLALPKCTIAAVVAHRQADQTEGSGLSSATELRT